MGAYEYAKLVEVEARLWAQGATPSAQDKLVLAQVIGPVSRWIDDHTGRRFYYPDEDESRYFTAKSPKYLEIPDLAAITSLKTDEDGDRVYEVTWSATDYDLWPYNASLDNKPYLEIRIAPNGSYGFPTAVAKGVEITGSFGYCADGSHPGRVREATILQVMRMYLRKDAPFGIAGNPDLGELRLIPKLDPDIKTMLDSLVRGV